MLLASSVAVQANGWLVGWFEDFKKLKIKLNTVVHIPPINLCQSGSSLWNKNKKQKTKHHSLVGPGLTPFYTLHPHSVTCIQYSPYTCLTSTATEPLFSYIASQSVFIFAKILTTKPIFTAFHSFSLSLSLSSSLINHSTNLTLSPAIAMEMFRLQHFFISIIALALASLPPSINAQLLPPAPAPTSDGMHSTLFSKNLIFASDSSSSSFFISTLFIVAHGDSLGFVNCNWVCRDSSGPRSCLCANAAGSGSYLHHSLTFWNLSPHLSIHCLFLSIILYCIYLFSILSRKFLFAVYVSDVCKFL